MCEIQTLNLQLVSVFFFPVANFRARGKFRKSARAREKSARGKKDLNFARETCKLPVAK